MVEEQRRFFKRLEITKRIGWHTFRRKRCILAVLTSGWVSGDRTVCVHDDLKLTHTVARSVGFSCEVSRGCPFDLTARSWFCDESDIPDGSKDYHQNARLTVHSREQLARYVLEQGRTLKAAAADFNVSNKTAAKWVRRYCSRILPSAATVFLAPATISERVAGAGT